jgi:anaerobic magnesium-protoporphyrin IX monomethyl ester cyclase
MSEVDVLLINPPYPRRVGGGVIPPINLCYLAAALRSSGANPEILDLSTEIPQYRLSQDIDDVLTKHISRYNNLRLVGVGPLVTATLESTHAVVATARKLTAAKIVVGGPLCSVPGIRQVAFDYLNCDVYVAGDGEIPIRAIWQDVASSRDIVESPGIGLPACNEPTPYREPDLDALPLPARDLLVLANYIPSARRRINDKPVMASFLSRGCPYACTFCAAPLSSGRVVRRFSPGRVRAEVEDCARLGYENLIFYDDCLFVKGRDLDSKVLAFARAIQSADWTGGFQLELRCDAVVAMSDTALAALASVGCEQVSMGIEKGDAALLAAMRKRISDGVARQACERLSKYSIRSVGTFILGGPGETVADLESTIAFATSLPLDFAHFNPLAIHPGTALFNTIYGTDDWLDLCLDHKTAPFGEILWRSDELPLQLIVARVREAYHGFYTRERCDTTLRKVNIAARHSIEASYQLLEQERASSWLLPPPEARLC